MLNKYHRHSVVVGELTIVLSRIIKKLYLVLQIATIDVAYIVTGYKNFNDALFYFIIW